MKTKLLLSLIGLLFASATVSAQSSVWKVTKGKRTVYLGGTCQVLRTTDYPLPKEYTEAFEASPLVYFETDMLRLQSPEAQQMIASRTTANENKTLDKILSPESWRSVMDYCGMAGIPEDNMSKVQAWHCRAMLTSVERQKAGVAATNMETHLFQQTLGTTKIVAGLDTIEQHINYQTRLGTGRESELIELSLNEISTLPAKHDSIVKAWRTGDLAKLDDLLLKSLRQDHPALYREMYAQRTADWLPKIEDLFQSPKAKLVIVGVGHLAGPEGLLAQLRKRGYTIEQL